MPRGKNNKVSSVLRNCPSHPAWIGARHLITQLLGQLGEDQLRSNYICQLRNNARIFYFNFNGIFGLKTPRRCISKICRECKVLMSSHFYGEKMLNENSYKKYRRKLTFLFTYF